jgi:ElaB/YqjD/DUF883 family membrane-anchored ribosome-binding protein
MADTTDMAPTRSAPARKSTNGHARARTATRRTRRAREDNIEDQIERLQADLKAIAGSIAGLADDKVSEAKGVAKSEFKHLLKSGQHAVDGVQDEFTQVERQIKDTIRERPLTAVAGAVAIGFCLALLTR